MNCILAILIVIIVTYFIKWAIHTWGRMGFRIKSQYLKGYYNNALNKSNDSPFYVTEVYNKDDSIDKFFSVSIYGSNPKYFNGLKNTMRKVEKDYPGWKMRVYAHEHIPEDYKNMLISNNNIETYMVHDDMVRPGNSAGAFWRFLPLLEPVTSISIDADHEIESIGAELTTDAINKWINSDKGFFRSVLLPWSKTYIQGGGWGKKNFVQIPDIITNYPLRSPFGADELFLQKNIYPLVSKYGITTFRAKNKYKTLFNIAPKNTQLAKYDGSNEEFI